MLVGAAGPWDLGWEFVLAVVTLLLALFTGGLAWVTRRLARTTALEVQSQSRPILVPVYETFNVSEPTEYGTFNIDLRVRNIGVGPALQITMVMASDLIYVSSFLTHPVLAPSEHTDLSATASLTDERPRSPIRIEYRDLAGRIFATEVHWSGWYGLSFKGRPGSEQILYPNITLLDPISQNPRDRLRPPTELNDALAAGRQRQAQPLRYRVRHAISWTFFPAPGQEAPSLPRRLRATWQSIRIYRGQTITQRIRWARRAYVATKGKPIPHARVERWRLSSPYRFARGWKYAVRTYRNIR
jgi:hypothetical protein